MGLVAVRDIEDAIQVMPVYSVEGESTEVDEAKLNRPKVCELVRKNFNNLVLEILQARFAMQVKGAGTETTARRKFTEIAPLTPSEYGRLLQLTEAGERETDMVAGGRVELPTYGL